MERRKLEKDELGELIAALDGWNLTGDFLNKRFTFANFAESLAFVNVVGDVAERHDHHPDITFGWGYAEINLTTHDRGGVSDFDFAVATEIEHILAAPPA